ncbi:MAG: GHKL domain-containing protein, partial [Spirochaetales bacterium]
LTTNTEARVILINPVFSRQLDLKPDLPLGGPIDDYVSDAGFCDLVRKISSGAYTSTDEIPPYEFSPASNKFLLVRGQPVVNDENEFLGAVMTISDITAIKMLDRIKSEFVAEVSHELRSPLSTIHEQLALVINDGTNGKLSEDIPILSRALEKTHELISLVGDLLDLTRIEAGTVYSEPKPVRVGEMIRKIVDFLSTRVEKRRQHLTIRVPEEGVPEITADPLALESIFGNLITNAINYTQDEGEITVTVAAQPGRLVVEVRDNGFGIEKENQARVFDKFYRIKSEKTKSIPGTGLGLPIVKLLVDNLGGTIDLSSEPGKGSCFTVSLPI